MISINAVGDTCPIPVIKAKRAIRESGPDANIQITVDNEIATQNLEKMAHELGLSFSVQLDAAGNFMVLLTTGEASAQPAPDGDFVKAPRSSSGIVVVISSNTMGRGDDALGASLLKAFIFTLAELDDPPDAVVFYNSGISLTTEGSAALEDLARLERRGCRVLSCGACLNYYDLQDKLRAGDVTNMLKIIELQAAATRVIMP